MAEKQSRDVAQQTFRQFAWNLAGTLSSAGADAKVRAKPASKPGAKR